LAFKAIIFAVCSSLPASANLRIVLSPDVAGRDKLIPEIRGVDRPASFALRLGTPPAWHKLAFA
jgi:hypothetical protein